MAEEAEKLEVPSLASDLEGALAVLSSALAEANQAIATISSNISQVRVLTETVREMEAAMALARQNLSIRLASTPKTSISPMTPPASSEQEAVAPSGPEAVPVAALLEPETETSESPAPPPEPETEIGEVLPSPPGPQVASIEPGTTPPEPETIRPISHRMRMTVGSKVGSLDLKAVDGAVNENPAVVDVALLDYDGRHATLKLWISGTADPRGVQESLLASLRRRLGDDQDAEVDIDFEEAAAA